MLCTASCTSRCNSARSSGAGLGEAHEFGIGVDGGEMMAKIVRYGAGHSADGGQAIRLEQLPVSAFEFAAHSVKGQCEFANLCGAIDTQFIIKIALAQGAGAGDQRFQRASDACGKWQPPATAPRSKVATPSARTHRFTRRRYSLARS